MSYVPAVSGYLKPRVRRWEALLPEDVAMQQASWEWNTAILRAMVAGSSIAQIARACGVSTSTVQKRAIDHANQRGRSPAERYLRAPPLTAEGVGALFMAVRQMHAAGLLRRAQHDNS